MLRLLLVTAALTAACALDSPPSADGACTGKCDSDSDAPAWTVNDVSILYPLPTAADVDRMLKMVETTDDGRTVTLLPEALFRRLGIDTMFLIETPDRDKQYPLLRVTALRFDPCLEQREPDAHCRRAVRLIAQPVADTGTITDASIHLFYELDDTAFASLLVGYRALVGTERFDGPLFVHPVLAREGYAGPFAQGLRVLLLEHLGEANLVRMTFMATGRSGTNWFWGMFNRRASGFVLDDIPMGMPGELDGASISLAPDPPVPSPLPTGGDFPEALFYKTWIDRMTDAELLEAAERVYRIEDPATIDSTNLRCSSCHLAGRLLDLAFERRGLPLPADPHFAPPRGQNLTVRDETRLDARSMHGFSYFHDHAAVSRRVVKDSAVAADFLSSGAFAKTLGPAARAIWTR